MIKRCVIITYHKTSEGNIMRSLIILMVLIFSTQIQAKPVAVYSGVFCSKLSGVQSLFKAMDESPLNTKIMLKEHKCSRIPRAALANIQPTFKEVKNHGEVYYVYRFNFVDYGTVMFGYSTIPPSTKGGVKWDI